MVGHVVKLRLRRTEGDMKNGRRKKGSFRGPVTQFISFFNVLILISYIHFSSRSGLILKYILIIILCIYML